MASLKELKGRIASVQGTRRITSAMKMVAAAKLKRATAQAEASRPYAERMERMLSALVDSTRGSSSNPFLVGTGKRDRHLVVLVSSDRGLCGSFNSSLTREVDLHVKRLQANGQTAKFLAIGRKGVLALRRNYHNDLLKLMKNCVNPRRLTMLPIRLYVKSLPYLRRGNLMFARFFTISLSRLCNKMLRLYS